MYLAKKKRYILASIAILTILALPLLHQAPLVNKAHAVNPNNLTQLQMKLLSGFAAFELGSDVGSETNVKSDPTSFFPKGDDGCSTTIKDDTKVNQNCLNISTASLQGRAQSQNEPAIAADPNHPNHVVAGYNDYRRGDGTCGSSYSLDGGSNWQDSTVPNGFTLGAAFGAAREYWEASGDTSVAWDTKGNAYLDCQVFQRGPGVTTSPDFSSAIYVFRSTQNFGASWNFAGRPVVQDADFTGATLEDKPYMTVDNNVGSPFQDRIYVTWTFFNSDGTAYIMESHSNDYGQTFSTPVAVNTDGATLCNLTFGLPTPHGNCNENQFSQPIAAADGTLYVVYDNYNNAVSGTENRNQILLSKSVDGGMTFSAPVRVAYFYDLPDCATYQGGQDFGRACVPEKGSSMNSIFRATNYPAGAVDPKDSSHVIVTFGSYINSFSKETNGCVPASFSSTTGNNLFTGVKTAGACNNKILLSQSTNGGVSFTGTTTDPRALPTVNQDKGQATTDQWWQWAAFSKDGKLAVSYYDRQYGNDETTGNMDISVSGSSTLTSFGVSRATSDSMPLPTQFPDSLGNSVFFGDYAGLSAVTKALPIWSDTRDSDLFLCPGTATPTTPPALCAGIEPNGLVANDQDIFTTRTGIPEH